MGGDERIELYKTQSISITLKLPLHWKNNVDEVDGVLITS